jgi:hypothetical protein
LRITSILLMIAFFALLPATPREVLAAPLPPLRVVNHETRECGQIPFGGDECMDCFPPAGWEVLGIADDVPCPPAYALIGDVSYNCQPFKNQFCCSEGHSGAPGDCQDLVVNDRARQCAFVDNIADCELPRNWSKRSDSVEPRSWVCPAGYEWLESLECGAGSSSPPALPCLGAITIGPFLLSLWWVGKNKR